MYYQTFVKIWDFYLFTRLAYANLKFLFLHDLYFYLIECLEVFVWSGPTKKVTETLDDCRGPKSAISLGFLLFIFLLILMSGQCFSAEVTHFQNPQNLGFSMLNERS